MFDYCIYWLMGTKPGTGFDQIWDELGALLGGRTRPPAEIRNFEEFSRVEFPDGEVVRFYADLDRLEAELLRVAPEDRRQVRKLVHGLKRCAGFAVPAVTDSWGRLDWLRFAVRNLPALLQVRAYAATRMESCAARWKSPRLRQALSSVIPGSWSAIALLFGLGVAHDYSDHLTDSSWLSPSPSSWPTTQSTAM